MAHNVFSSRQAEHKQVIRLEFAWCWSGVFGSLQALQSPGVATETVVLPKPGQRLFGLSRTTLLELSSARKIRSVSIKKPGAVRGIRLIFMPSLREYLASLPQ
jgi:hypothetical protein